MQTQTQLDLQPQLHSQVDSHPQPQSSRQLIHAFNNHLFRLTLLVENFVMTQRATPTIPTQQSETLIRIQTVTHQVSESGKELLYAMESQFSGNDPDSKFEMLEDSQ